MYKYQFEYDEEIQACYYCPCIGDMESQYYCELTGTEITCKKDKLSDCPLVRIVEEKE